MPTYKVVRLWLCVEEFHVIATDEDAAVEDVKAGRVLCRSFGEMPATYECDGEVADED